MDNITAILAAHGASLADVVNIRTFLTEMGQLPEYGKVRAARFTGTRRPSRRWRCPACGSPARS